jgi:hypothetical protein
LPHTAHQHILELLARLAAASSDSSSAPARSFIRQRGVYVPAL